MSVKISLPPLTSSSRDDFGASAMFKSGVSWSSSEDGVSATIVDSLLGIVVLDPAPADDADLETVGTESVLFE